MDLPHWAGSLHPVEVHDPSSYAVGEKRPDGQSLPTVNLHPVWPEDPLGRCVPALYKK